VESRKAGKGRVPEPAFTLQIFHVRQEERLTNTFEIPVGLCQHYNLPNITLAQGVTL
jgi:hypothetical protein